MKNLIIILLFLFTSAKLFAVNKKNYDYNKTKTSTYEFVNQINIITQSNIDFLENMYGNCKITLTFVNGDGETEATISIDTNTDTAQECHDLADSIFDLLTNQ